MVALLNSFALTKAYMSETLYKTLTQDPALVEKAVLNDLYDKGMVVDEGVTRKSVLETLRAKARDPEVNLAYFLLEDGCNLGCTYCFVNSPAKPFRKMTPETARSGVDFFLKIAGDGKEKLKAVVYGGEPLLNPETFYELVIYARKSSESAGRELDIDVNTNGTLVEADTVKLIRDNEVSVSVSIDGWKELHDARRKSRQGLGTFDLAVRGYRRLQDAGCRPSISCTISQDNIAHLPRVVEYFHNELGCDALGFNPPICDEDIVPEYMADQLFEAFKVARKLGVYEDRVMRLTKSLVEEQWRLRDCAGSGAQIVILPNGSVGPCQAFQDTPGFFSGTVFDGDTILKNRAFEDARKRYPLGMAACEECEAIATCGGGCYYQAYKKTGDMFKPDAYTCRLTKRLLELSIWDLYDLKISSAV